MEIIKNEYKITSYYEQVLDTSFTPVGRKYKRWSIYRKEHPYPNKSIEAWMPVENGFKSQKAAEKYLAEILAE